MSVESWSELRIALLGGDDREREIARLAATTGATVTAFGFPWPDNGIPGVQVCESAEQAIRDAEVALFPIPGIATDGTLFAPQSPAPILPSEPLLSLMAPDAHIILGTADDGLRTAADALGITLIEYESDRELMLLRAPAIAEGAIALAVEATDVTLHASDVAVIGYGNIGTVITRTLVALGARVHVVARNPVQRAAAFAAGATPWSLDDLAVLAPRLAVVFSTVPAHVIKRDTIELLPADALVMDLSAPPGSVDLELVRELGRGAIWARGLGRRAPVTVGRSQWSGIRKRIEETRTKRESPTTERSVSQ